MTTNRVETENGLVVVPEILLIVYYGVGRGVVSEVGVRKALLW